MGIRLNSTVVHGVLFTDKETKAFEKFMSGKPHYWLLMRYVEQEIKKDWEDHAKSLRRYDCSFAHNFLKIDPKKKTAQHPYVPFWEGLTGKDLQDVEGNLPDACSDHLEKYGHKTNFFDREIFWTPESSPECQPKNMMGFIMERNYAREVDYALRDILKIEDCAQRIIEVKGTYPWETGTYQYTNYGKKNKKVKGMWDTLNVQNMLPRMLFENDDDYHAVLKELSPFKGSKKDYEKKKRDYWERYHGKLRPYKTYPGDGWGGADFYFYSVDEMLKLIASYVPEVKYNIMRLQRYLCFYWS